VNSSLTLRPSARLWANRRSCGLQGRAPTNQPGVVMLRRRLPRIPGRPRPASGALPISVEAIGKSKVLSPQEASTQVAFCDRTWSTGGDKPRGLGPERGNGDDPDGVRIVDDALSPTNSAPPKADLHELSANPLMRSHARRYP